MGTARQRRGLRRLRRLARAGFKCPSRRDASVHRPNRLTRTSQPTVTPNPPAACRWTKSRRARDAAAPGWTRPAAFISHPARFSRSCPSRASHGHICSTSASIVTACRIWVRSSGSNSSPGSSRFRPRSPPQTQVPGPYHERFQQRRRCAEQRTAAVRRRDKGVRRPQECPLPQRRRVRPTGPLVRRQRPQGAGS